MAPKAAEFVSVLTDRDVRAIKSTYRIPSRIQLFAPTEHQRVNDFEAKRLAIYEEMLKVGIRFPFKGLATEFLRTFHIAPAQIMPNSWRIVRQLELWAREAGVRLSGNSLLHVLTIKWSGDFLAVQGMGNVKIVEGMLTSNKNWRPNFFFARRLDRDGEECFWDVPVEWRDNVMLPDASPLIAEEKLALGTLKEALKSPIQYTPPSLVREERGARPKRSRKAEADLGEASPSVVPPQAV